MLSKIKKTEIMSRIFTDNTDIKLEIRYKKKTGNFRNMWSLTTHYRINTTAQRNPKRN